MLQSMGVLQNLNNVPVDMTLSGLDALGNAQQADAMALQNQQRLLDFNTQNDPLMLEQQRLANQSALARLPGIEADSAMRQRENTRGGIMFDEEIKQLRSQYKDADIKRYIQQMDQLGTVFRNAAEFSFQNPLGASLRARQMLDEAGGGELWNPEWDNLPPEQLAMKLHEIGKAIQENNSGYSKALDLASMQAASAEARKRIEWETRETIAAERRAQAEAEGEARHRRALQLVERKAELSNNNQRTPRDYQELSTQYLVLSEQARMSGDVEAAQRFRQQAEELYLLAEGLRSAAARTSAEGQVDTGKLANLPTRQVPGPVTTRNEKPDPLGIRN